MNRKQAERIIGTSQMKWYKKQNLVAGMREGYPVVVQAPSPSAGGANYFMITVTAAKEPSVGETANLQQITDTIKGNYKKITAAAVYGNSIKITGVIPSFKKFENLAIQMLAEITLFLKQNGYAGCCMGCGRQDVEPSLSQIDNDIRFLCDDCFERTREALEENRQETRKAHGNLPLTLIGAFFGVIPGILLWIFISNLDYQPMFAGALIVVGSAASGAKLGRKMSVFGFVFSIVWSFIAMLLAQWLAYGVNLWLMLRTTDVSMFVDSMFFIPSLLKEYPNVLGNFILELVLGMIFFVIGIFGALEFFKKSRGHYTAERIV